MKLIAVIRILYYNIINLYTYKL